MTLYGLNCEDETETLVIIHGFIDPCTSHHLDLLPSFAFVLHFSSGCETETFAQVHRHINVIRKQRLIVSITNKQKSLFFSLSIPSSVSKLTKGFK